MPFGLLEIAIVVVIALVFFGYKKLPALGRSAGEGVKQLKGSAQEMVGDKLDPSTLGKSAGRSVREMREFKQAVTGVGTESSSKAQERKRDPQPPTAPHPPAEPVDGELVEPGPSA